MPGHRPFEILLVEDSAAEVALTREVLTESRVWHRLHVCSDGSEALAFLRPAAGDAVRPDIILLDLNMPRMDGREFLTALRADPALLHIPVVVLTTSRAHEDVLRSYRLHANAFITKPLDFAQFVEVIRAIEDLWLNLVELPGEGAETPLAGAGGSGGGP